MLSESDQQLFSVARQAQMNRNTAIQVLNRGRGFDNIFGCFVRVLLELPEGREDYVLARVQSTMEGEEYSGFSLVPGQKTNIHLVLQLPPSLAVINGVQYQLNSISNSTMREGEFVAWLTMLRKEMPSALPSREQLLGAAARLRAVLVSVGGSSSSGGGGPNRSSSIPNLNTSNNRVGGGSVADISQSMPSLGGAGRRRGSVIGGGPPPVAPHSNGYTGDDNNNNNTNTSTVFNARPNTASNSTSMGNNTAAAATVFGNATNNNNNNNNKPPVLQSGVHPHQESEDEALERRIRQEVMNQLGQSNVMFPTNAANYKLSRLRLVERDMIEYLQHIRDEIAGKQENCVVCLDHVPTVIVLPCKHKVMCRLCAPAIGICPVCRSPIKEMFEPEEI